MKRKLLFAAMTLIAGAWSLNANAQTDVTDQYITNGGFDTAADFQAGNIATGNSNQRKAVTGWTDSGGNTYTTGGCIGFNTTGQINGANIPTTNSDGTSDGGALTLNAAWQSSVYYSQEVTLPAGNYRFIFKVNNVGKNEGFNKDPTLFAFSTDKYTFCGNVNSYPVNTWTEQKIEFGLPNQAKGTLKIGYKANNTGSGNTPKLVVDYVKAFYVSNYTSTLQSTIVRANALYARQANADLNTAISHAQEVLTNADNTVEYQSTIDSEVETLNAAITTALSQVLLLEGEDISFMIDNSDFESGNPVSVGVTTYDYDCGNNGTYFSQLQTVEGWTIEANGNGRSAGVFEFGANPFLGSVGTQYQAPSAASKDGQTKALGIVAVWSNPAQYKQAITLPAGAYVIEIPVYNTAGATAFSKNLIGFVEDGGTEHLATAKTYAVGSWVTEKITFNLENETSGYLSLGYTAGGAGSAAMPHLFIDYIKVTYTSPIAAAKFAWDAAYESASNALNNPDYVNVTGQEYTTLSEEVAKAEPTTIAGYEAATTALNDATTAFVAAKANYDAFATAKALTLPNLVYATDEKKQAATDALAATATSSEDAATKAAAIYTTLRAYYESHAKAESEAGAVDLTNKLTNTDNPTNINGWTVTNTTGNSNMRTMSNEPYTNSDGTTPTGYFDSNSWGAAFATTFTQDVELPAGKYLLAVKARGSGTITYQLTANGVTTDIEAIGNTGGVFGRGWNDYTVEFELSAKTNVALGMNFETESTNNWLSFGNFRLTCLYAEMASASDYEALNAAIAAAEGKTLGFAAGEFAPYANVDVIKAIATAKDIDQGVDNPKDDITALTETLTNGWTANTADVDAIYNGDWANSTPNATSGVNVDVPGWTLVEGMRMLVGDTTNDPGLNYASANKALFSWGGTTITYGEQTGYTLPLIKNAVYELSFKASAWRDGDWPDWVSVDLDGVAQSGATSVPGKINDAEGNPFRTYTYYLVPTADNSILKIYMNHHFTITDISLKPAVAEDITIDEDVAYTPAKAYANVTLKRTIKNGDAVNTVVLPFEVTDLTVFGDDAKAYEVSGFANDNISFTSVDKIRANVPVLLKTSTGAESFTFENVFTFAGDPSVIVDNLEFKGLYATDKAPLGSYILSSGKIYNVDSEVTLKGTRAFFQVLGGSEAKALTFSFDDGEATGIATLENGELNLLEGQAYDLSGRAVKTPTKGLYIINGKKVFIK